MLWSGWFRFFSCYAEKYSGNLSRILSVFWPILMILKPGWSLLVLLFPSFPHLLSILWGQFQVHQLQLASPSPSRSNYYYYYYYYYFRFIPILPRVLACSNVLIIYILCIYVFYNLFWVIFSSHIDSTHLKI